MDSREFLEKIELGYSKRRNNVIDNFTMSSFKNVIEAYYTYVEKPEFSILVEDYKQNYIYNEARVEKNITLEEQLGLGEIYDYISDFDFSKDKFNIFITSMILHQKLYSKCPNASYGGKLRNSNVYLFDTSIEIVDSRVAQDIFNSYIGRSDDIFNPLIHNDLFGYIESCIKLTVDLIKLQPFQDGNKRTFRALLNLLLKRIDLPPIYIDTSEKDLYKEYILIAMNTGDYSKIISFYYIKICDEIVKMNLNQSKITEIPKIKII